MTDERYEVDTAHMRFCTKPIGNNPKGLDMLNWLMRCKTPHQRTQTGCLLYDLYGKDVMYGGLTLTEAMGRHPERIFDTLKVDGEWTIVGEVTDLKIDFDPPT